MNKKFVSHYFYLNEKCVLIKGRKNGAIYDVDEGEVYALGEKETLLIEHLKIIKR